MKGKWWFYVSEDFVTGGTVVKASRTTNEGTTERLVIHLEIESKPSREVEGKYLEPSLFVSREMEQETDFLHAMAEALVQAGYAKPSEDERVGELKATKVHLEDMRTIVFKKLEKELR